MISSAPEGTVAKKHKSDLSFVSSLPDELQYTIARMAQTRLHEFYLTDQDWITIGGIGDEQLENYVLQRLPAYTDSHGRILCRSADLGRDGEGLQSTVLELGPSEQAGVLQLLYEDQNARFGPIGLQEERLFRNKHGNRDIGFWRTVEGQLVTDVSVRHWNHGCTGFVPAGSVIDPITVFDMAPIAKRFVQKRRPLLVLDACLRPSILKDPQRNDDCEQRRAGQWGRIPLPCATLVMSHDEPAEEATPRLPAHGARAWLVAQREGRQLRAEELAELRRLSDIEQAACDERYKETYGPWTESSDDGSDSGDEANGDADGEIHVLPWCWTACGSEIVLSGEGLVATKHDAEEGYWQLATGGLPMTEGRHYWEVELTSMSCTASRIGAVRPGLDHGIHHNEERYAYYIDAGSGSLCGNGKDYADKQGKFDEGDRIGVLLDLDAGWMRFYRNGKRCGPGYTKRVTGPLVRAAELGGPNEIGWQLGGSTVTILPGAAAPEGAGAAGEPWE
jgi:hypothetical protein